MAIFSYIRKPRRLRYDRLYDLSKGGLPDVLSLTDKWEETSA